MEIYKEISKTSRQFGRENVEGAVQGVFGGMELQRKEVFIKEESSQEEWEGPRWLDQLSIRKFKSEVRIDCCSGASNLCDNRNQL